MSNHGNDEFSRHLNGADESPPTDKLREILGQALDDALPAKKLTERDEGPISFDIGHTGGRVVMNFGKSIQWIGLSPIQARDLAFMLLSHADAAPIIGGAGRKDSKITATAK